MDRFPDNQPERIPDEIGVRLDDIDKDALMEFIRIYLEEARGADPTMIDETGLQHYALMTGMMHRTDDGEMEVRARTNVGFWFGSNFSPESKLCFRTARFQERPVVYLDFDDNISNPPQKYYEALERFKMRIGGYLIDRGIAVPVYL